jgi:hypothetical protein
MVETREIEASYPARSRPSQHAGAVVAAAGSRCCSGVRAGVRAHVRTCAPSVPSRCQPAAVATGRSRDVPKTAGTPSPAVTLLLVPSTAKPLLDDGITARHLSSSVRGRGAAGALFVWWVAAGVRRLFHRPEYRRRWPGGHSGSPASAGNNLLSWRASHG